MRGLRYEVHGTYIDAVLYYQFLVLSVLRLNTVTIRGLVSPYLFFVTYPELYYIQLFTDN